MKFCQREKRDMRRMKTSKVGEIIAIDIKEKKGVIKFVYSKDQMK